MDASSVWSVLKWVLAVLVAGFIGQFGRVLAVRLIERRRRERSRSSTESNDEEKALLPELLIKQKGLKAVQKVEKKRAKAELKRAKKEG